MWSPCTDLSEPRFRRDCVHTNSVLHWTDTIAEQISILRLNLKSICWVRCSRQQNAPPRTWTQNLYLGFGSMAKLHKKLGNEPAMARHHIHFCSEGRLHILGSLHNLFEKDRSQSSRVAVSKSPDILLHKAKHIPFKRVCCQEDAPESKGCTLRETWTVSGDADYVSQWRSIRRKVSLWRHYHKAAWEQSHNRHHLCHADSATCDGRHRLQGSISITLSAEEKHVPKLHNFDRGKSSLMP